MPVRRHTRSVDRRSRTMLTFNIQISVEAADFRLGAPDIEIDADNVASSLDLVVVRKCGEGNAGVDWPGIIPDVEDFVV